jgi:hypothetical protein
MRISTVCGAVLIAALALPVAGQDQSGQPATSLLPIPHPRQWIEVKDGVPYVVPVGKTLEVMSVGVPQARGQLNPTATLTVDGVSEVTVDGLEYGISMQQLPVSVRASPGQSVAVFGGTGQQQGVGRAWCYVIDNDVPPRPLVIPPPEAWVRITQQQSYQVPPGRLLVVSTGGPVGGESITVRVNGSPVLDTSPPWALQPRVSPRVLPAGLVARPGDVVTVEDSFAPTTPARLHGYLVDP